MSKTKTQTLTTRAKEGNKLKTKTLRVVTFLARDNRAKGNKRAPKAAGAAGAIATAVAKTIAPRLMQVAKKAVKTGPRHGARNRAIRRTGYRR